MRARFLATYPQPDDAIQQALEVSGGPVVINETSDNPGCGGPGDGTHLLRSLLDAHLPNTVFCGIRDPDVVQQAHDAGVGSTIELNLGGKTDQLHGAPIECSGYVKVLTDGETVIEASTGRGWRYPLGPTALLSIEGVEVIVITRNAQTLDRTPLILHGIDPLRRKIVGLKSSQHFRSGFQSIAAAIITTDPPGLTTVRLEEMPRVHSPRPVFPLDVDAAYGP
jgi:microcystin degradation protein MlrC